MRAPGSPGVEREDAWTDAGKASASGHGVTEYEVVEALVHLGSERSWRSGLIRRAIDEYLERHAGEAA